MVKYSQLEDQRVPARPPRRFGLLAVLIIAALVYQYNFTFGVQKDGKLDWNDIKPSENLKLEKCFDNKDHLCARLSLPLDYQTPEGPKTHIAIRVYPATDKANYQGALLINPGGPGGSGTEMVVKNGKNISTIVGPEFDIVGFDPRGTGATWPGARCFDSSSQYSIWRLQAGPLLSNRSSPAMIAYTMNRELANAQLCEDKIGGNGKFDIKGTAEDWGIGHFMSTASVATDMLRISEQFGQEKLKYWGFSYGTVLGQYFSAMYPEKVDRVMIDGVYDAENYRAGLWDSNLEDTDKVMDSFYNYCHAAGKEKCSIWEETPREIKIRLAMVFHQVKVEPIPLPHYPKSPIMITTKFLRESVFIALYSPLKMFGRVADVVKGIETVYSDGPQALTTAVQALRDPGFACNCSYAPRFWDTTDMLRGVACGDADENPDQTFEDYIQHLHRQSDDFAPTWTTLYHSCSTWKLRPKWRYTGPLSAKTAHPLLILQPLYDPVCPLSDARKVAKRYEGSRILQQNSEGHCTISSPSICTAKVIRAYLINGTLPEEGTECEPDVRPFVGEVGKTLNAFSAADQAIIEAYHGLGDAVPRF